jgi:diadenylate cyclase
LYYDVEYLWKPAVEIGIIFTILYTALRFMQGTRGAGILKGLAMLLVIVFLALYYVSQRFALERINFLLSKFLEAAIFALIIIFQPELRRGLVRLGQAPLFGRFVRGEFDMIDEIEKAITRLSKNRVGALIAIERNVGLGSYAEGGVKIDADIRSELLDSIFYPGSSLHDGAVIIQGGRIVAAGCLLPLSENPSLGLGTRHRAGVGLTEETDAIAIVVSEETGRVSIAVGGEIKRGIDFPKLSKMLREYYLERETRELAAK